MNIAKRLGYGFFSAVIAYFVALFGCAFLMPLFNPHAPDAGLAASVAGAMLVGPLVAVIAFVAIVVLTAPKTPVAAKPTDDET